MSSKPDNQHRINRSGWLRAAVLGADDGILSTASLVLGVATAHASREAILIAGVAGLVAGSMSMAAGEYVSVHSQTDIEKAELRREADQLRSDPVSELDELASIYVKRGVETPLAEQVAGQLMRHDALDAHARDELGISHALKARPLQAALASALSFFAGAALPLLIVALVPAKTLIPSVAATSIALLAILGALASHTAGAKITVGALRIGFWGGLAMIVTAGVGKVTGILFGIGG